MGFFGYRLGGACRLVAAAGAAVPPARVSYLDGLTTDSWKRFFDSFTTTVMPMPLSGS